MRFQANIIEATEQDETSNSRRDTACLSHWTNSEETNQFLAPVLKIQRAWRTFRNSRQPGNQSVKSKLKGYACQSSERDETTSETDSYNGVQMMSLSTPDDGERNLKIEDDLRSNDERDCNFDGSDEAETLVGENKPSFAGYSLAARCGIDSEPESIVSDYSEMADPIKEHLANVQIIQKEDLELGNTFSSNGFLVQPKIYRGSEEDEEQFNKRLRKTNYLSLAQEFAELKKINASALPFGLHKNEYQTASPLSDGDSGSDLDCADSNMAEAGRPEVDQKDCLINEEGTGAVNGCGISSSLSGKDTPSEMMLEMPSGNTEKDNVMVMPINSGPPMILPNSVNPSSGVVSSCDEELDSFPVNDGSHGSVNPQQQHRSPAKSAISPLIRDEHGASSPDSPRKVKMARMKTEESVSEFDIYTVETALPQMDWQHLEEQLQKAAEEEKKKWLCCGDREEIRRKLAMPIEHDDDDDFDSNLLRKPSLQTRLQTNMNLHMCFVNEAAASDVRGNCVTAEKTNVLGSKPDVVPVEAEPAKAAVDENEDFFAKQARLQAEAKMALAQVRPMAHMQLQLEKQLKRKSPLAEIVGISGLIDGKMRRFSQHILLHMNFAQLQVVVNDLHAQIEVLNIELMQQLVERDDLHMAQDSMLVDIEDLTGRAQEFAARVNKRAEKREYQK